MITEKEALRQTQPLGVLVDCIASLCKESPAAVPERVQQALREAVLRGGLLTEDQKLGRANGYVRHLLYEDPHGRFSIVSLVWSAGQFSPVHGHYTWCSYVVAQGRLQEECYNWDGERQRAVLAGTAVRDEGYTSYSHAGLDAIHRFGNPGGPDAVSVHVYGLDGERLATHVNRVVQVHN
jgi:predicted metal-dependent enzyme (double-stranded beta helix superfamily)